jgi:hypothetical protein
MALFTCCKPSSIGESCACSHLSFPLIVLSKIFQILFRARQVSTSSFSTCHCLSLFQVFVKPQRVHAPSTTLVFLTVCPISGLMSGNYDSSGTVIGCWCLDTLWATSLTLAGLQSSPLTTDSQSLTYEWLGMLVTHASGHWSLQCAPIHCPACTC